MKYSDLTMRQKKKARAMEFDWLLAEVMKKFVGDMRMYLEESVNEICQKQEYEVIKDENGYEEVVHSNERK